MSQVCDDREPHGSHTWEQFEDGLPQGVARPLVAQHYCPGGKQCGDLFVHPPHLFRVSDPSGAYEEQCLGIAAAVPKGGPPFAVQLDGDGGALNYPNSACLISADHSPHLHQGVQDHRTMSSPPPPWRWCTGLLAHPAPMPEARPASEHPGFAPVGWPTLRAAAGEPFSTIYTYAPEFGDTLVFFAGVGDDPAEVNLSSVASDYLAGVADELELRVMLAHLARASRAVGRALGQVRKNEL